MTAEIIFLAGVAALVAIRLVAEPKLKNVMRLREGG